MDRDEAVRKDALPEYNLFEDYLDYVGDTRKMGGLFTKEKDSLEADEKEQLKEVFAKAEVNGSNMWQTVISFDNKYLAENGKAIEINTKTYQDYHGRTPVLDRNILLRFKELGGEAISLGSDSHNPERVGDKFREYAEFARSCGFTRLAHFENRKLILE